MKKYRLVTGFYPSKQTATKILKKAKGNCPTATIEEYEDSFIVLLAESDSYDEIYSLFSKYMKAKLFCGIMSTEKQ